MPVATMDDKQPVYATYSDIEHVLARPQMYVGRREITHCRGPSFAFGESDKSLTPTFYDAITSPLLEKVFDEVLVNAMDASIEDSTVTKISVSIDRESGLITVVNDGAGIPVRPMSDDVSDLVPTVIFGKLRSSSKFDDARESLTGGMNGVGVKLTNIWSDPSKGFTVRTLHPGTRREFSQTWTDHMRATAGPKTKANANKKGWVEVTFTPDYSALGIALPLDACVVEMLHARVFDACACTHPRVRVLLDARPIPLKGAAQYAAASFGAKPLGHDVVRVGDVDRLEVYVADDAAGRSLWLVNGQRTRGGGTIMDDVIRKVTKILTARARERAKNDTVSVRPALVKESMGFVVVARIPNARFTSQEKDVLESPASKWGFSWAPSKAFVAAVEKSRLVGLAMEAHATTDERKTKTAVRRITQPPKLDPALRAGKKGAKCTLILTEGDSAKATVVAAIDVIGRDSYGIFPLRGKPISGYNPKLYENEEVKAILSILHIDPFKKTWTEAEIDALPYSAGVLVVADADVDGRHITGLVLCLMQRLVPDILRQRPHFVRKFASPIMQAHVRGATHSFLTEQEYDRWREAQDAATLAHARIDYFKGLGSWSSSDARRFFARFREHTMALALRDECLGALKLFFDPTQSNQRKGILTGRDFSQLSLDYSRGECTITDFLHREMIHFSADDLVRSIARLDSLKPGARKVMWGFRKRNYTTRVKVAQAGAGVAEISAYHHGETSLIETIVKLAQTHVGTNNLNLLIPKGQFGSRANQRTVHAAPRYIFCRLSPLFDLLCPRADDAVLPREVVDGITVEPTQYAPVVALPLINGVFGIGTGFSTSVPNYKPEDVIEATKALIHGGEAALRAVRLLPWYRGFYGEVLEVADKPGVFELRGKLETTRDTIRVTELPPGKWTTDFREHLKEVLVDGGIAVKPPINCGTEHRVHIEVTCDPEALAACRDKLPAMLGLHSIERTTNMWLWNVKGELEKFVTPHDIILACAAHRLEVYEARRAHQMAQLEEEIRVCAAKERFVREERDGVVVTRVADEEAIVAQLRARDYHAVSTSYEYLLEMQIRQKTDAALARLGAASARKCAELQALQATTPKDMWLSDIRALETRLKTSGLVRDEEDDGAKGVKRERIDDDDDGRKR